MCMYKFEKKGNACSYSVKRINFYKRCLVQKNSINELTPFSFNLLILFENMIPHRPGLTLFFVLQGELTFSSEMESLSQALFLDAVPDTWSKKAYPSLHPLGLWYGDLQVRVRELDTWVSDFSLPGSVWLGGLFNPQSFLTAIMQQMARKNEWPLDRMCLQVDVTKKQRDDVGGSPREGAYVHGLFMEGAKWEHNSGVSEANLMDLAPPMPVMFVRAVPVDRQELRGVYPCPVYKTKHRGPTFVWTFNLKTKEKPSRWILAGVALLLQI